MTLDTKDEYTKMTFFLATGKSFTFNKVKVFRESDWEIHFRYVAASDGLYKEATFYKAALAGIGTLQT